MNAPASHLQDTAALASAEFRHIPVSQIRPSQSQSQALRRQTFTEAELQDLAASFTPAGIIEPLIVRPLDTPDDLYEIAAGERRFLAARLAGLASVPCLVRILTDADVLRIQITENLQRKGLTPLQEGEGYHELMALDGINADQLADQIGKSRSYVYARTKLRDLHPDLQEKVQHGEIDASIALLLARFKSPKLQHKAYALLERQGLGSSSYRKLATKLREDMFIRLDTARFDPADESLTAALAPSEAKAEPHRGSCRTCPHNSANDAELHDAVSKSPYSNDWGSLPPGAYVCTHTPCFELKTKIYWRNRRDQAIASGQAVITGTEAQAMTPPSHYYQDVYRGHLRLDATCDDIPFPEPQPDRKDFDSDDAHEAAMEAWSDREDAWKRPTYREVLGDTADTILVEGKGQLFELLPIAKAKPLLKAKGLKVPQDHSTSVSSPADDRDPEQDAKLQAQAARRQRIEEAYRKALLLQIAAKWGKSLLKLDELRFIASAMLERDYDLASNLAYLYADTEPDPERMSEPELVRLIALTTCAEDIDSTYGRPGRMLALAQRFKIDEKAIRAKVTKAIDAPEEAAVEPKKPAKKKAAKKSAKS